MSFQLNFVFCRTASNRKQLLLLSLLVSFSYGHQRPWGVKTKLSQANVGDFQSFYNKTKR